MRITIFTLMLVVAVSLTIWAQQPPAQNPAAAAPLQGGQVTAFAFVIELDFLKGRARLGDRPLHALIHY